ncbi:type 2 periplasmic-binding domain-containing protein [Tessaracoccus defluvii]|uniref:Uncharacterized protein n=1 Tax=Tessaracoccus defluvii TaxID=1285901 RepID=A0A7H0H7U6_9ACTN|nr:hypothetical protein [Tessaracoccus defluvii]QNP56612.1 hypothetical protein H9L22_04165 [Tessaracoccus defluvii]
MTNQSSALRSALAASQAARRLGLPADSTAGEILAELDNRLAHSAQVRASKARAAYRAQRLSAEERLYRKVVDATQAGGNADSGTPTGDPLYDKITAALGKGY